MKVAMIVAGTFALAACTQAQPSASLSAAGSGAGTVNCIVIGQIAGRHVVPPGSVMFEMAGPVNYRNDLAGVCPGIERLGATAAIELSDTTGGQLCSGDRIRLFDPVESKATGVSSNPACVLGRFTPVPRGRGE